MTRYVIVQAPEEGTAGYRPYGAAAEFWACREPEIVLSGPYETGKTLACLHKLHVLMAKYPGAKALMVRRTYKSLVATAAATYERKVLPYPPGHIRCPVRAFGAVQPQWYGYPNGSRIVLGGLDRPEKFLSGEYDFIYVNQAEELRLEHWEMLTGRATGRAGNAPYAQVMGDCNPDVPWHWLKTRPQVRLFESRHVDNPVLFSPETSEMTEQGRRTMAVLDALTGVRYKRGRLGLWVAAEGQVYDFDPAVHVAPRTWMEGVRYTVAGVDWGYTNPGVISVWGVDGDKRMGLVHEVYQTGKLIDWWVETAKRLWREYGIRVFACDPQGPAYIEAFRKAGLRAVAADNRREYGIQRVQERLKLAKDGRPRLVVLEGALEAADGTLQAHRKPVSTEQEFANYVYPLGGDGRATSETPVEENDHGMDAMRYAVMWVEEGNVGGAVGVLAQGKSKGWGVRRG